CAIGKRNIGAKIPKNPAAAIHRNSFKFNLNNIGMPKKAITIPENATLNDPICVGLKTSKDLLIKIKELPQVSAIRNKRNHLLLRKSFIAGYYLLECCETIKN